MGILEWGIIAGALVFVFVCVCILAAVLIARALRSKPKAVASSPLARIAAPVTNTYVSPLAALDDDAGADAIINAAFTAYATQRKVRHAMKALAPLQGDPSTPATPGPKAPPA